MKLPQLALIAIAALASSPSTDARGVSPAGTDPGVAAPVTVGVESARFGWRANERDHVSGVSLPSQITHPAKVDFDRALAATDEWKRVKREGIDPESAEGRALRRAATRRIAGAAETVQGRHGYCSVWKSISHTDGRQVPDVTSELLLLL